MNTKQRLFFAPITSLAVLLLVMVMSIGCSPGVSPGQSVDKTPHIGAGSPMAQGTPSQRAEKIYNDMRDISEAVEKYRRQHGNIPVDMKPLVESGLLNRMSGTGTAFGDGTYALRDRYDDMDGRGAQDAAIYTNVAVPLEVCAEFNRRYAAAPLQDGTIFDYQMAGNKYPGELFGRDQRVFAIKWETAQTVCEIDWVLEYRN